MPGHRHISRLALKRLRLDELWWLVSPQNPLKPVAGMAPFAERLAGARAIARHPRIRVTGIEADLKTTYTAETLRRLARRFPHDPLHLADGGRQSGPDSPLEGLDTNL